MQKKILFMLTLMTIGISSAMEERQIVKISFIQTKPQSFAGYKFNPMSQKNASQALYEYGLIIRNANLGKTVTVETLQPLAKQEEMESYIREFFEMLEITAARTQIDESKKTIIADITPMEQFSQKYWGVQLKEEDGKEEKSQMRKELLTSKRAAIVGYFGIAFCGYAMGKWLEWFVS